MKTHLMILLILLVGILPMKLLPLETWSLLTTCSFCQEPSMFWLQETPVPDDVSTLEEEAPRPPSEAGQNMVLIFGAVMLVLIVFFGVAINLRRGNRDTFGEY